MGQRVFKDTNWYDEEHERFEFDSQENNKNNDNIILKFNHVLQITPPYRQIMTYFVKGIVYFYWASLGQRLCKLEVIWNNSCADGTVLILIELFRYVINIKILIKKIKCDLPHIANGWRSHELIKIIIFLQGYYNATLLTTCVNCTNAGISRQIHDGYLCIKCYIECEECGLYDRHMARGFYTCDSCFCKICGYISTLCMCHINSCYRVRYI